jgi:hypothetical protein
MRLNRRQVNSPSCFARCARKRFVASTDHVLVRLTLFPGSPVSGWHHSVDFPRDHYVRVASTTAPCTPLPWAGGSRSRPTSSAFE